MRRCVVAEIVMAKYTTDAYIRSCKPESGGTLVHFAIAHDDIPASGRDTATVTVTGTTSRSAGMTHPFRDSVRIHQIQPLHMMSETIFDNQSVCPRDIQTFAGIAHDKIPDDEILGILDQRAAIVDKTIAPYRRTEPLSIGGNLSPIVLRGGSGNFQFLAKNRSSPKQKSLAGTEPPPVYSFATPPGGSRRKTIGRIIATSRIDVANNTPRHRRIQIYTPE